MGFGECTMEGHRMEDHPVCEQTSKQSQVELEVVNWFNMNRKKDIMGSVLIFDSG